MGQEKSVPIRCNICHSYSSSNKSSASPSTSASNLPTSSSSTHKTAPIPVRSPSRSTTKSTKSSQSSKNTLNTSHTKSSSRLLTTATNTSSSSTSSSSYKRIENQTKYLNHQLYIKSYLDIKEENRVVASHFQPSHNGIRNYMPKILLEQTPPTSTSASSTSSNEQEDIDIWI